MTKQEDEKFRDRIGQTIYERRQKRRGLVEDFLQRYVAPPSRQDAMRYLDIINSVTTEIADLHTLMTQVKEKGYLVDSTED